MFLAYMDSSAWLPLITACLTTPMNSTSSHLNIQRILHAQLFYSGILQTYTHLETHNYKLCYKCYKHNYKFSLPLHCQQLVLVQVGLIMVNPILSSEY